MKSTGSFLRGSRILLDEIFDEPIKVNSFGWAVGYLTIFPQIFNFLYNLGQNIWNKIEKSSKTGQDKKSLISTFACFLTATAKV